MENLCKKFIITIVMVCVVSSISLGQIKMQMNSEPVKVANGMWFLGAGPSPSELELNITNNINAADSTNADQLWNGGGLGLNLSGAGVTVGIWDGGAVRSTHQELTGRVTVVDSVGIGNHATHVAGTIGATGLYAPAHGMANNVQIRSYDWNNDTSEMNSDASLINISNHSYSNIRGWTTGIDWGVGSVDTWYADRTLNSVEDPGFGKYTSHTKELDGVLYDNPKFLSVWSAGNERNDHFTNAHGDNKYVTYLSSLGGWYLVSTGSYPAPPSDGNGGTGYDCLSGDQTAKNTLVVGSVIDHTVDPHNGASIVINSFSSYGPTDDGRMGVDVVGNGNSLTSSYGSSDSAYASMSGTSMSAPNVAGTMALLVEHYRNNKHGDTPNSATLKALAIHTATDAGNTGPDYSYGYGLVNAADAAGIVSDGNGNVPGSNILEAEYSGSEMTWTVIATGLEELKATLVWTDPEPTVLPGSGLDDSTAMLVNDLNIWLTDDSNTYYPWTLDPANPSDLAVKTQLNHTDNEEQVLIDSPLTDGVYTIHIGDTGGVSSQDFSLIFSGIIAHDGDADMDGDVNSTDLSILLGNWNQSGMSWIDGDFNSDYIVNSFDLSILLGEWGWDALSSAPIANVPEPTAILLILFGLPGIIRKK